jgi:hypothetical protein
MEAEAVFWTGRRFLFLLSVNLVCQGFKPFAGNRKAQLLHRNLTIYAW